MSQPQFSVVPNARVPHTIVLADDDFLVVAKPAGVVTQPGVKHDRNTVLNGLFATHGKQLQNLGKARDFGLIHRLDAPTSGALVVGLSRDGYDHIRGQFVARTVEKTYLTLVHGSVQPSKGIIEVGIREQRVRGRKRAIVGDHPRAREARTRFETLSRGRGVTLLACQPHTGRLHQIRAHLAHRKSPVIGDREYGPRAPLDTQLGRKFIWLHAAELRFQHPRTGNRVTVRVPLPDRLAAFLEELGITCPKKWR